MIAKITSKCSNGFLDTLLNLMWNYLLNIL